MRVYLTFCSAEKNESLKNSGQKVFPEVLYTSQRIQSFMRRCKSANVYWAILSDQHGVWFSREKHAWYEKHPNSVSEEEFAALVTDFNDKLAGFDEIYFCPGTGEKRVHFLYKRLLGENTLLDRIVWKPFDEIR